MREVGDRVLQLNARKALKADGTIDWTRWASHVVEADGGDGADDNIFLRHISGAKGKCPAWVTADCVIESPSSCMGAMLKHASDGTSVSAISCFDDLEEGPYKFHVKKGKDAQHACFEKLHQSFVQLTGDQKPNEIVVDPSYLQEPEKKLREEAKMKAAQRMKEKAASPAGAPLKRRKIPLQRRASQE